MVLGAAAAVALVLANSPLETFYTRLLDLPVAVQIGALAIAKPLPLWINDGLMAIFFMLVGLEVKRAVVEGDLSSLPNAALPVIAALARHSSTSPATGVMRRRCGAGPSRPRQTLPLRSAYWPCWKRAHRHR